MINQYEYYMTLPKALSFDTMQSIHLSMISEIGTDPDALELYDELVYRSTLYSKIRSEWLLLSHKEQMEKDPGRTACHNSVITYTDILARYLKKKGHKAEWRETLGYEKDSLYNRKTIGDFACYLAFINGICAR